MSGPYSLVILSEDCVSQKAKRNRSRRTSRFPVAPQAWQGVSISDLVFASSPLCPSVV
jgi:hypothetical protein